ncbi:cyclase dehydrase [Salinarimonas sp.]|uniref:cyclase dehydrase n=1 Tax=Salinarimonas sp. TaxID=2766526 RepID=UPI0032D98886
MRYEAEGSPRRGHPDRATDRLAHALGLFSIGLGLAELAAPRAIAETAGLRDHEAIVRGYGAREIATGVALLAARDPMPWVWARVLGDAADLVTLAQGRDGSPRRRRRTQIALGTVAAVTLLDIACAATLARETPRPPRPLRDYRDRVGFPRPPERMRGKAREMAGVY